MKQKVKEANPYYQSLYPGYLILYKLPLYYVAFGEFGVRLAKLSEVFSLKVFYEMPAVIIEAVIFQCRMKILEDMNISYKVIAYVDDTGMLSIPDVQRLVEEEEMDY